MLLKRFFIFLFFLNIFNNSQAYEKIVDWNKEETQTDKLIFDGENFYIDSEKNINKKEVSYIVFNLSEDDNSDKKIELKGITAEKLLKRAEVLEKEYSDSSLLVLYDDGIQKLNKDGTQYTRSRYSVKIMKENELSEHSILSFYYVKGQYESKIIMARSISADGKISYLKESDITYTTPKQGLAHFSGRKDDKIIKAVIPNVKIGSIVDFEYEVTEASPEDKNQFYTSWFFGGNNPVFESKVKYIIPDDKQLFWVTKNFEPFDGKPKISSKDGYKIYSFERGICPPIIGEDYGPPVSELYPAAFGSLHENQTYLSGWLSKFMTERMKATDKMKETVKNIIKKGNAKTEEEKIAVIYRFVQEYIHYRSIKTSLSSGFSGHPAEETFTNKYGDCIDKAILFATLLDVVGVEAYPVIVRTNDKPRALYNEIGVVTGNHAITEIHLKEKEKKIIYLDSTSTTYRYPSFRYDDQGIPVWNPILNTVRYIDPINAEYNTQKYKKNIKLMPDGSGKIKNHITYSGDWEAGLRGYFLSIKPEELKTVLSSIVARDYPGSYLTDYKYGNPTDYNNNLFLEMDYDAVGIAKTANDFLIMEMPVNYEFDYVSLNERKTPIKFPTTEGKENELIIIIPDGYKIKGLPESLNINNKYIKYKSNYELIENKIIFKDHFQRNEIIISVEDYQSFKKDILKIDNFIRTPLIFEKIK